MKLSFFLKAISALGLITTLSITVASTVKQSVQAETQNEINAEAISGEDCITELMPDGTFHILQGIEFTPEQEAASQQIGEEIFNRDEIEPTSDWELGYSTEGDVTVPDDIFQQIDKAYITAASDQIPDSEQIDELNEKYGDYVEFGLLVERLHFTPEQLVEQQERRQEYQAAILSILTPEQQPIYLRNMETDRAIEACME